MSKSSSYRIFVVLFAFLFVLFPVTDSILSASLAFAESETVFRDESTSEANTDANSPTPPKDNSEPVATAAPVPMVEPAVSPAVPTETATAESSVVPATKKDTEEPTVVPTEAPSGESSTMPTVDVTEAPTVVPTEVPTEESPAVPTVDITEEPTVVPTEAPSEKPSSVPAVDVTEEPTVVPTETPSMESTEAPTEVPTVTPAAESPAESTAIPTEAPTAAPSVTAAAEASKEPTAAPTAESTTAPSVTPSDTVSEVPSELPTATPDSIFETESIINTFPFTRVQNLSVSRKDDYVYLKWSAVADATSYQVFRSNSPNGDYSLLGSVNSPNALDAFAQKGQNYYYKIRAAAKLDNGSTIYSLYSNYAAYTLLDICSSFNAYAVDTNAARLTWNSVPGATGYQVFRTVAGTGVWQWVKNNPTPGVNNYSLKPGTVYYYKIRAYTEYSNGSRTYGPFSAGKKVQILAMAQNLSISNSVTTNTLKWNKISGATGYQVFYTIAGTGGIYTWAKNVTTPTAKHMNLDSYTDYYYKVRAYVDQPNGVRAYGQFSNAVHKVTGIAAPKFYNEVLYGCSSLSFNWKSVPGRIEGYEIYRKESGGSWNLLTRFKANLDVLIIEDTYVLSGESDEDSYWFSDEVLPNKIYYYAVCAYSGKAKSKLETGSLAFSTIVETPHLRTLRCINSSPQKLYFESSWSERYMIDGETVSNFEIQYSTAPNSGFKRLAVFDRYGMSIDYMADGYVSVDFEPSKSYLQSGKLYYFRIRAIYYYDQFLGDGDIIEIPYYSGWSNVVGVRIPK